MVGQKSSRTKKIYGNSLLGGGMKKKIVVCPYCGKENEVERFTRNKFCNPIHRYKFYYKLKKLKEAQI